MALNDENRKMIWRGVCAAVLIVAFAAAAGRQSLALREARHSAAGTTASVTYSAEVPPMVTFATVALGGFRGMIADLLWIRATKLQDERRYVELVQLSSWITKLEPHMAEVWVFHAWNLAYNVGVRMSRPEDRWRWVLNGIELLRDEGLVVNPRNALLYVELGWMFQHKLGMDADLASPYFRTEWANMMSAYLGEDGAAPEAESISAQELQDVFRLDAVYMRELEETFGAIDWRVPAAHSLYWGAKGLDCAGDNMDLRARRMVYMSLMEMASGKGRMVEGEAFEATPNAELMDSTIAFIEETMAKHQRFSGIKFAYVGTLTNAMRLRHAQGREDDVAALYGKLTAFFAGQTRGEFPSPEDVMSGRADEYLSAMIDRM